MKEYALLIDYKFCTGCHSCEVACRQEKAIAQQELWGIKVTECGPLQMNDKWMWNYVPIPSDLCDVCIDRIHEGQKPACVHHCLAKCMEAVPLAEVSSKLAQRGDTTAVFIP